MSEIISQITLGADPEIGYIKNGQQVMAYSLLRNTSSGVGLDGHSDISEIRLKGPVKTPTEIVSEIRGYLKELNTKLDKNIIVVAGGLAGPDPLGGHIHFGNTKFRRFQDMHFYGERLDLYLAIPVLILENTNQARARRQSSYGRLFVDRDQSAIETKNYGGFEYRTLSSYLVSPSMTDSIISLAHTIVHEIDYGSTRLKSLKQFKKMNEIRQAFINADKRKLLQYIPKIFSDIQKCQLFKANYEKKLAGLFGLIKAFGMDNKDWLAEKDILVRWGIRKNSTSEVNTPDTAVTDDIPRQSATVPDTFELTYNAGDFNLGDIVSRLASRRYMISIHLYGIRDNHGIDILYYYNNGAGDLVGNRDINMIPGLRIDNHILCERDSAHLYIGISKAKRRNIDSCVSMLVSLLQPFEVMG